MNRISGYTPSDRLTHSMMLMQSFAYRNDINLRLLFSSDPIDCLTNRLPSREMYDATIGVVTIAAIKLRRTLTREVWDDEMGLAGAVLAGDLDRLVRLIANDETEFQLTTVGVDWILQLTVLLATVDNVKSKVAFRALLSNIEFDRDVLCMLPLAAAAASCNETALHIYEIIEGLPAYSNTFSVLPPSKKKPAKDDSTSDGSCSSDDVDDTSEFDGGGEDDDDEEEEESGEAPTKKQSGTKRKNTDDFVAADDESLSKFEESSDDDERPLQKKSKTMPAVVNDDDDNNAVSDIKSAVQQRRKSTIARSLKKNLLPFAQQSDVIRSEWRYDFGARATKLGKRIEDADAKLFGDFVHWLSCTHDESLQCEFYTNICTQARGLLDSIGSANRKATISMLCKLASAGRIIVLCKPESRAAFACSLCATSRCRRCCTEVRITIGQFSERAECEKLGITEADMWVGSHCGERFMRVVHLYWLLNAARWQPARKSSVRVVRDAFVCIMDALAWAKSATTDLARRGFKLRKFNAGPVYGDEMWDHEDGDPLYWASPSKK